jgi:hypothetical protein
MDLSIEKDAGIVDPEGIMKIAGFRVFRPHARAAETGSERKPPGLIDSPPGFGIRMPQAVQRMDFGSSSQYPRDQACQYQSADGGPVFFLAYARPPY